MEKASKPWLGNGRRSTLVTIILFLPFISFFPLLIGSAAEQSSSVPIDNIYFVFSVHIIVISLSRYTFIYYKHIEANACLSCISFCPATRWSHWSHLLEDSWCRNLWWFLLSTRSTLMIWPEHRTIWVHQLSATESRHQRRQCSRAAIRLWYRSCRRMASNAAMLRCSSPLKIKIKRNQEE